MGSNVFILRYLLSEILDFKSYSIGYSLINPNATYEDLYNDKNLTFKNNSEYGVYAISLNRSSIWQEKFYTNSSSGDVSIFHFNVKLKLQQTGVFKSDSSIGSLFLLFS